MPSAPSTSPISEPDSVKRWSSYGRYAAVVVIENASPNAPSPRSRRGGGCLSSGARRGPLGGETAADDVDDRPLGVRDLGVAVRELPEHPAGQQLVERRRRRRPPRAAGSRSARKSPVAWPRSTMRRIDVERLSRARRCGPAASGCARSRARARARRPASCSQVRSRIAATWRSCSRAGSSDASTAAMRSRSTPQFSRKTVSSTSSFDEK